MEINSGVQLILKFSPVSWSRSESRRSRGQDRMKVKGQQDMAVVGGYVIEGGRGVDRS